MRTKTVEPVEVPAPAVVNPDEGPVVIQLTIPRELYNQYKDLADGQDLTVAELMTHRLTRCQSHSSIRSIYFSTTQVQQLEQLFQKRPLETPDQVLASIKAAFQFSVGELPPIPITPLQAKRIHIGTPRGQTPYDRLCYVVQGAVSKMTGA